MNKPNKILFIVPLPPPVHGSSTMCQFIQRSKLINDNYYCDFVNLSTSHAISEVGKFGWIKVWRLLIQFVEVLYKLFFYRYSLCYIALAFHNSLLKDAVFVLLCKLFSRKVVIHLHGKGAAEDSRKLLFRWLLKTSFKKSKVILLSWQLYPDIEQFVSKTDVYICPNGIPISKKNYYLNKTEKLNLLFLSNLVESKGVIILLDALRILKEKGYAFVCNFVGGETRSIDSLRFHEEVEKRQLEDYVIYRGKKYGAEKDEIFSSADIFVYPTYCDCFPLVLLEAMQFGLPVVTTNEGAISDYVKDGVNGFVVERKNSQMFAASVEKLITDENLRKEMGAEGYKIFKENYSIASFEKNLCMILSDISNVQS